LQKKTLTKLNICIKNGAVPLQLDGLPLHVPNTAELEWEKEEEERADSTIRIMVAMDDA
jgi:hypothetical protein